MAKKHQVVVRREPGSSSTVRNVRYVECQKNHAANIGGYAVDGCMEFLASGEEGTNLALVCAACGCHRNFHRRVVVGELAHEVPHPPPKEEELFQLKFQMRMHKKPEGGWRLF